MADRPELKNILIISEKDAEEMLAALDECRKIDVVEWK